MSAERTPAKLTVTDAGDAALMVDFGGGVTPSVNARVIALADRLLEDMPAGIHGVIPAYASCLVEYDPRVVTPSKVRRLIAAALDGPAPGAPGAVWDVPVCYGGSCGPDLEDAASVLGLSRQQVITLHTGQSYRIYCIGFSPGFPLAGLLPPELRLPRRADPRTAVPPGAVAIAGAQTGIYPGPTPGGWHILGLTPARLFDWERTPPCAYKPGDALKFRAISHAEHERLIHEEPWLQETGI